MPFFCIRLLTLFNSKYFPGNSAIYNSLKAFPYLHTDFQFQSIQVKTYKRYGFGYECVGVGQFREGTNDLHGVGIEVNEFGVIQEGYWKDGKQHGQGRLIGFRIGDYYIGHFRNGDFYGEGTYFWKDGRKYVGNFKNNMRYENGIQYNREGEVEEKGFWTDDKYVGNY